MPKTSEATSTDTMPAPGHAPGQDVIHDRNQDGGSLPLPAPEAGGGAIARGDAGRQAKREAVAEPGPLGAALRVMLPRASRVALPNGKTVPLDSVLSVIAALVTRELRAASAAPDADAERLVGEHVPPERLSHGMWQSYIAGNRIPPNRVVIFANNLGYAFLGYPSPDDMFLGVASEGAEPETEVEVTLSGVEEVETAGPVRAGTYVEVADKGRIVEAAVRAGRQTICLGRALTSAKAGGGRVSVLISPSTIYG